MSLLISLLRNSSRLSWLSNFFFFFSQHYLVAEYFMTAPPSVSPEGFYAKSKQKQADLIWTALFLKRSPVSEACRGVITTLITLGLEKEVQARDLNAIRSFFDSYRNDGVAGAERYCEHVYKVAGIKFAIMTNIPFDPLESQHWRPTPKVRKLECVYERKSS